MRQASRRKHLDLSLTPPYLQFSINPRWSLHLQQHPRPMATQLLEAEGNLFQTALWTYTGICTAPIVSMWITCSRNTEHNYWCAVPILFSKIPTLGSRVRNSSKSNPSVFFNDLHIIPQLFNLINASQEAILNSLTPQTLSARLLHWNWFKSFHADNQLYFPSPDTTSICLFTYTHSVFKLCPCTIQTYLSGTTFFFKLVWGNSCSSISRGHLPGFLKDVKSSNIQPSSVISSLCCAPDIHFPPFTRHRNSCFCYTCLASFSTKYGPFSSIHPFLSEISIHSHNDPHSYQEIGKNV